MRIAVSNNTHDFRIAAGFVGDVFDTLAGIYRLRHALCRRIDAVGRDFLERAAGRLEIEVGVGLGADNAVHAEVGHFIAAVGDVDLTQRTVDGAAGGRSKARAKAQHSGDTQKYCCQSFSHKNLLKNSSSANRVQACTAVKWLLDYYISIRFRALSPSLIAKKSALKIQDGSLDYICLSKSLRL